MGYAVGSTYRGHRMAHTADWRAALQGGRHNRFNRVLGAMCVASVCLWTATAMAQPAGGNAPSPLRLCYERMDIPPWRTLDGKGLNIELIRMAAARAGVGIEFVTLPWKRCLSEMQDGTLQGVFAASFSPDRLILGAYPGGKTADPSMQLYVDGYVLVKRRQDAVQWDGKSISGMQGAVGAQVGYSVANDLRKMGVPVDESSQTAQELLQKLQLGRIGAAALGTSDAAKLLADTGKGNALAASLDVLPVPLVQKAYYLMLSNQLVQDHPDVANRLWQQIGVARRSPQYQKLVGEAMARQP